MELSQERFDHLLDGAYGTLPTELRAQCRAVAVIVEPQAEASRSAGRYLLGRFRGLPVSERGEQSRAGIGADVIAVYRGSFEACCDREEDVRDALTMTLRQEMERYLGLRGRDEESAFGPMPRDGPSPESIKRARFDGQPLWAIAAMIFLPLALGCALRDCGFFLRSARARGRVDQVFVVPRSYARPMPIRGSYGRPGYRPRAGVWHERRLIVSFKPREGSATVVSDIGPASRRDSQVGDPIDLRYDPGEPSAAKLDEAWALWGDSIVLALLLVACLLADALAGWKTSLLAALGQALERFNALLERRVRGEQ